jgi:capsular polysaccharide biosynthesis protein
MAALIEFLRRKAKNIELARRDLRYKLVTRWVQTGSPSGHAPRSKVFNPMLYARMGRPGVEWVGVIPRETVPRHSPSEDGGSRRGPGGGEPVTYAEQGVFCAREARVAGGYAGAVITADERLVVPFSTDPLAAARHRSSQRFRLPPAARLTGRTAFLGTPEADTNYYHFTFDLLPRLILLEKAGFPLSSFDHFLVNLGGNAYEVPLLARMGVPADRIRPITPDTHYRTDMLMAPSRTQTISAVPSWKVEGLRARLAPDPDSGEARLKLLALRGECEHRRVVNEGELSRRLQAIGFKAVVCKHFSIGEQIAMFARARTVVGAHGAALTNLVYCRPGTRVIEIVAKDLPQPHYAALSEACGLDHSFVGGSPIQRKAASEAHRANKGDIEVPWPLVERVIPA